MTDDPKPAPKPDGAMRPGGPADSPARAPHGVCTPNKWPQDDPIDYPTRFPIKVVGVNEDGFVHAITRIARRFDPGFDAASVELRPSRGGKYLGLTITVLATSRAQLDELYRTLSTHPMARWVL